MKLARNDSMKLARSRLAAWAPAKQMTVDAWIPTWSIPQMAEDANAELGVPLSFRPSEASGEIYDNENLN